MLLVSSLESHWSIKWHALLFFAAVQAGWATTAPVRVFFRLTFHRRYFWLFDNKKEIFEGTFELSQHLLSPALSRLNWTDSTEKLTGNTFQRQSKKDTNGGGSGPSSLITARLRRYGHANSNKNKYQSRHSRSVKNWAWLNSKKCGKFKINKARKHIWIFPAEFSLVFFYFASQSCLGTSRYMTCTIGIFMKID